MITITVQLRALGSSGRMDLLEQLTPKQLRETARSFGIKPSRHRGANILNLGRATETWNQHFQETATVTIKIPIKSQ